MAKVYSWEVSKNPKQYAYIVHPLDTSIAYVGSQLTGDNLQKVIDWAGNCTEVQYEEAFERMKQLCEFKQLNVEFEHVDTYMNVKASCDNLQGKNGRGIKYIRLYQENTVERTSTYAIYYDDDTYDTFIVQHGADGVSGTKGAPGDQGVSSIYIMAYTSGKDANGNRIDIKTPSGGAYNFITNTITYPDGWHANDSSLRPPVFMSSCTIKDTDTNPPVWSAPMQISGEDGAPGADGVSTEFIYCNQRTKPDTPVYDATQGDSVPKGWTDSPVGVTEDNQTEWYSIRKKNDGVWTAWSEPVIWSQYGVNGQDGDGVQYIYIKTKTGVQPKNPTPNDFADIADYQNRDGEWVPPVNSEYTNINGDTLKFIPNSADTTADIWTDNPNTVTVDFQYQWVSNRKYRKNEQGKMAWGQFSDPALWGKYGEDGKNATSIRKLYALSDSTSNPPDVPTDNIFTSDWGSGFPLDYESGVNVVWGIEAEIWAHNNEFVKKYQQIKTPNDATDSNTKEVTTLPTEEIKEDGIKYILLNDKFYAWKGGWSEPYLVTGTKGLDASPIDFVTYVFGWGYDDSIPNPPNGGDIHNLPTSSDQKNRTIDWYDFPDTSENRIDGFERENGVKGRWYQCTGEVDGLSMSIKKDDNGQYKWGQVQPCNGRDGEATPGRYTEFRFRVTEDETPPELVKTNRNPAHWKTTSEDFDKVPSGGAMWQIWANIDGVTEQILDGQTWNGPVRVSGEKGAQGPQGPQGPAGLRGVTGLPGASLKNMYCLGTFEEPFGDDNWKDDMLVNELTGWFEGKNMPSSDAIDVRNDTELDAAANAEKNHGRVVRYIRVENNITTHQYYYLIPNPSNGNKYKVISDKIDSEQDDFGIYMWCIQGPEIWERTTVNGEEQDQLKGIDWSTPFKMQGTNGLRGIAGNRGQVVYPMGVYNPHEVYRTTMDKAPYVYDSGDGLFYVYNIVDQPWVGQLPTDFKTIQDKDGKYKYSFDGSGTEGTWLTDQEGETPSQNFANNDKEGGKPAWVRFESFQALYTSIGIIANGMIGSAVYNNEFMFSQQGVDKNGNKSTEYEKFLDGYQYDETGNDGKHWKYKDTSTYIPDIDVNPYEIDPGTKVCIHSFQPNVCINFSTGQMWLSCGKIRFGIPSEADDKGYNVATEEDINNAKGSVDDLRKEIEKIVATGDGKGELHYGNNDPSTAWNTVIGDKLFIGYHVGDLWYKPDVGKSYVLTEWVGTAKPNRDHIGTEKYANIEGVQTQYIWIISDVGSDVYDIIDGKANVFVEKPKPPYSVGDLWFVENNDYKNQIFYGGISGVTSGTCMVCMTNSFSEATEISYNHWGKRDNYADEAMVQSAMAEMKIMEDRLNAWGEDGYLNPTEIKALKDEYQTILNEQKIILQQAEECDLTSEYTYIGYKEMCETKLPKLMDHYINGEKDANGCIEIITATTSQYNYNYIYEYYLLRQTLLEHISRVVSMLDSEKLISSALTDTTKAINNLKEWGEDDRITPPEMKALQEQYSAHTAEYTAIMNQAKEVGESGNSITRECRNAWNKAKDVYQYYTDKGNIDENTGCIPKEEDSSKNSYYGHLLTYQEKKQALLKLITSKLQSGITSANTAIDTVNGKMEGIQQDIQNTQNRLNAWGEDKCITPSERKQLAVEYKNFQSEHGKIMYECQDRGITASTAMAAYYNAYTAYTESYTLADLAYKYYTNTGNTVTDTTSAYYGTIEITSHTYTDPSTSKKYNYSYSSITAYYTAKTNILTTLYDIQKGNEGAASLEYIKEMLPQETNISGGEVETGLINTGLINMGDYEDGQRKAVTGGINGVLAHGENSVAFFCGGSYESAVTTVQKYADNPQFTPTEDELKSMAKFVITHGGRAILEDAIIRGTIYAEGGYFNGIVKALSVRTELCQIPGGENYEVESDTDHPLYPFYSFGGNRTTSTSIVLPCISPDVRADGQSLEGFEITLWARRYLPGAEVDYDRVVVNAYSASSDVDNSLYEEHIMWAQTQYDSEPEVSPVVYLRRGMTMYKFTAIYDSEYGYTWVAMQPIPFTLNN